MYGFSVYNLCISLGKVVCSLRKYRWLLALEQFTRIMYREPFTSTGKRNDAAPRSAIERGGNIPERRIELKCCFHYNTRPFLWLAVGTVPPVAKTLLLDQTNEKNISAQRPETQAYSWFSFTHGNQGWPRSPESPSCQGPQAPRSLSPELALR